MTTKGGGGVNIVMHSRGLSDQRPSHPRGGWSLAFPFVVPPHQTTLPTSERAPQQLRPNVGGAGDGPTDAHKSADAVCFELTDPLHQQQVEKAHVELLRRILPPPGEGKRGGRQERAGLLLLLLALRLSISLRPTPYNLGRGREKAQGVCR